MARMVKHGRATWDPNLVGGSVDSAPSPPDKGLASSFLAITLLACLFGCGSDEPPPALTGSALDKYVEIAMEVRSDRRRALSSGQPAAMWPKRPTIEAALDSVGWSMADYLRVEGQVAAARVRIEFPDVFKEEFATRDAPDEHVNLVRERIDELRAAQASLPDP
jgi:hypothetical protein